MTRRKHPPPRVDPDDYGFNVAGKGYRVTPRELLLLLGLDTISCAVYMRCLKPFADRAGKVGETSYYRFLQILGVVQSPAGGRRLAAPTEDQLRRALERLRQVGLITVYSGSNQTGRALQIRLSEALRRGPR